MANRYFLKPDTLVQLGSVNRAVEHLVEVESIVSYNVTDNQFVLTTVESVTKSDDIVEYQYVKINNHQDAFSTDAIVFVKNVDGNIVRGYFSNEKPVIEGVNPDDLYSIVPGFFKIFDGSNWEDIESIEIYNYTGHLYSVKVAGTHSLFVENVLISD